NTGSKDINTDHYGHNFLKIDDVPAGPDYVLEFPFELRLGEGSHTEGCLEVHGHELNFTREIPIDKSVWVRIEGFKNADDNRITIKNRHTGAWMRIVTDQPLSRMAFFSHAGVLSPEPFVEVRIAPGKTKEWKTVYTFGLEK